MAGGGGFIRCSAAARGLSLGSMARLRVELLVVLTGTLLLGSVRGWERINDTQLLRLYETGQWGSAVSSSEDDSLSVTPPGKMLPITQLSEEFINSSGS